MTFRGTHLKNDDEVRQHGTTFDRNVHLTRDKVVILNWYHDGKNS